MLARAARDVGVFASAPVPDATAPRRRGSGRPEPAGHVLLIESAGVLRWRLPASVGGGPRRSRGTAERRVAELRFEMLPPNRVGAYLETLDRVLTPVQGLRRLRGDVLEPATSVPRRGRLLLLVHGTFSSGETLVREIRHTALGRRLLERAAGHYDAILAFDHPTLSVSPWLNALDLARALRGSTARVDVIAHSRGGLVARWWLDTLRPAEAAARAVLVGSPLAGTGLAAPHRLRAALDLVTNLGRALTLATDTAGLAFPFLSLASGLLRVLSSLSQLGAHTPLLDAGVALVPGLSSQSRVGNNEELLRLRRHGSAAARYFAVRSHFESEAPGWRFWKHFVSATGLASLGAGVVFDGPSDLVVDTASMADLGGGREIADVHDFGPRDGVHHVGYFRHEATLRFLASALEIP
jgi:hypothetical protein